ncbi:MAG: HNH endonuclease [Planifilum sp.]
MCNWYLNKKLYEKAMKDPELKSKFSSTDLERMRNGDNPVGYTWHHHQDFGRMQIVDKNIHSKTGHTGGRTIWGGGNELR